MNNYVISCCSTVDLAEEHLASRNIKYLPFHFYLDDVEFVDDLGKTISYKEFYKKMEEGAMTKTSQINANEFVEAFTPILDAGFDLIHVSLSSGISGVYNSAELARQTLSKQFPERKIFMIDSLGASAGAGMLVDFLADLRDRGKSIEEAYLWAEEHKLNVHHWFFSTDLTYFVRGGRITKTAGFVGNILKICPLMNMSHRGELVPRLKLRGKKKAMKATLEEMESHAFNGEDYDSKCYISHAACLEDAQKMASLIEDKFPKLKGQIKISDIGTTIGSHTGPGTVAVFFMGNRRVS